MADSPADLQFERAEPTGQALAKDVRCVACRTPLSSYFEVNGTVACDNCKDAARPGRTPRMLPRCSVARRWALWLPRWRRDLLRHRRGDRIRVRADEHRARAHGRVRRASRRSGARRLEVQTLAMFLCYAAISATYVPRVISPSGSRRRKQGRRPVPPREARERRGHRCHQARRGHTVWVGRRGTCAHAERVFQGNRGCCSCFRWRCPCLGASTT